jgi:hypothetical protein
MVQKLTAKGSPVVDTKNNKINDMTLIFFFMYFRATKINANQLKCND